MIQLDILSIQQIKLKNMSADFNKQIRLTIQDLNKLSLLHTQRSSIPRQSSLLLKPNHKRSVLNEVKSERKRRNIDNDDKRKIMSSRGLSNQKQALNNASGKKILFLPQQGFASNSSDCQDNPEDKLDAYSSVRLKKGVFHRIQKNISERYQKKIQVLKQLKIPKISHQLLTISHFTHEALNSVPKHVQIFNEKLKLIRKSMAPSCQFDKDHKKNQISSNQMPSQLKTLRVIRKNQYEKNEILSSRQTQYKFRMYLTKRAKKSQLNPQIQKIQGWQSQKNERQRILFD